MSSLLLMAARYWMPFLAPVVLAGLAPRPSRRWIAGAVCAQAALSLALAVDDHQFALAQASLANRAHLEAVRLAPDASRLFTGHWGWQAALAARGWRPIEEDQPLPAGALLAASQTALPQAPAPGITYDLLWKGTEPYRWWGPRTYTFSGRANLYAYGIVDFEGGPSQTFAPWGFGGEVRDRAMLLRVLPPGKGGPGPQPGTD
jgi:hypothetical protein